ncbi:MAG TPA: hypothetical protein PLV45_08685, partial [bacterium]|nr:hypothetical protein [bacterium]
MYREPMIRRLLFLWLLTGGIGGVICAAGANVAETAVRDAVSGPVTVIDIQPHRTATQIAISDAAGRQGIATLMNLNPQINAWFALTIQWSDAAGTVSYHLENALPRVQTLRLDTAYPQGIIIDDGHTAVQCDLWSNPELLRLKMKEQRGTAYIPLAGNKLFLRNAVDGHKSTMEWTTDFLRNYIPGGDKITNIVKQELYQDAYLMTSDVLPGTDLDQAIPHVRPKGAPPRPVLKPEFENRFLKLPEMGIELVSEHGDKVLAGRWYEVRDVPGIYISTICPGMIADSVIKKEWLQVSPLDEIEKTALVHMVAFDLDQFDMRFMVGTEHPKVGWSDRVQPAVRTSD